VIAIVGTTLIVDANGNGNATLIVSVNVDGSVPVPVRGHDQGSDHANAHHNGRDHVRRREL
jgi:hypothetical protein